MLQSALHRLGNLPERDLDHAPQLPYLHLIRCPDCGGPLAGGAARLDCADCGDVFAVQDDTPHLYWPHEGVGTAQDVTQKIRRFYEKNPFPDYDEFDSLARLIDKARKGVFARLLDEQIPFGARVLECGCGTGQLSCFLGIAHRTVFGTDLSLSSLALAQDFRRRHDLQRVFFLQMNLFAPVFYDGSFDVVICNGVLHHTSDPYAGFQRLARLVKPGGFLIIGLYHRFGRIWTDLRRALMRFGGDVAVGWDPRLRRSAMSSSRRRAWIQDQYYNPHEVKYSIGTTLKWLEPNGLELVKTIPKTRLMRPFEPDERLFEPEVAGGFLSRGLIEVAQLWKGASEGGFFTVIARRAEQ